MNKNKNIKEGKAKIGKKLKGGCGPILGDEDVNNIA